MLRIDSNIFSTFNSSTHTIRQWDSFYLNNYVTTTKFLLFTFISAHKDSPGHSTNNATELTFFPNYFSQVCSCHNIIMFIFFKVKGVFLAVLVPNYLNLSPYWKFCACNMSVEVMCMPAWSSNPNMHGVFVSYIT